MGTLANIKVQPCNVSWGATDLGFLDGDIEVAFEEQATDITAHQEGTNVLTAIRTGKNITLSMTLKEVSSANLDLVFADAGGAAFTPAAGTEVIGWGRSKDFTSMLTQAQKLVLHPVANDALDLSEDLAFWKAYPIPESIAFSGENPKTMSISFRIFPDLTLEPEVSWFVIGDHTQSFAAS